MTLQAGVRPALGEAPADPGPPARTWALLLLLFEFFS